MEVVNIDKSKPLWWVILVIFCMAMIYSIGATSENEEYIDDVSPYVVENLTGNHT